MFGAPPTVQPGVVRVNWTGGGSSDPLVTGVRYALYSQCGAETTFQLIDDGIQGLSYDITTLPSLTQCVLRVVVYSDHCLLDVDGLLGDTTDSFNTGTLKCANTTRTIAIIDSLPLKIHIILYYIILYSYNMLTFDDIIKYKLDHDFLRVQCDLGAVPFVCILTTMFACCSINYCTRQLVYT